MEIIIPVKHHNCSVVIVGVVSMLTLAFSSKRLCAASQTCQCGLFVVRI